MINLKIISGEGMQFQKGIFFHVSDFCLIWIVSISNYLMELSVEQSLPSSQIGSSGVQTGVVEYVKPESQRAIELENQRTKRWDK